MAGVAGGPCVGFWFTKYAPTSRQKGHEHIAAQRLVVHDAAYDTGGENRAFYGVRGYEAEVFRKNGKARAVRGTFRARGKRACAISAKGAEVFPNGTCKNCALLEYNRELARWVKRSMQQAQEVAKGVDVAQAEPKCNHAYYTLPQATQKLEEVVAAKRLAERDNERLRRELHAEQSRTVDILPLLEQRRMEGVGEAICWKMMQKKEEGKILAKDKNMLAMMYNQAENLGREGTAKRHCDEVKNLHGAVAVKWNQGASNFLSTNLNGPSETTVKRWLPTHIYAGGYKETEVIVKDLKKIYEALITKHNLPRGKIGVWLGEDETRIRAEPCYDEKTDSIAGFCGRKCGKGEHECTLRGHCYIGVGGTEGYEKILEAMTQNQVATMGRCMMFIPLHRKLPAAVVFLAPTCNKFTAEGYVDPQWKAVREICNRVLGPVVGRIIGHASDGDARRRKLMLKYMVVMKELGDLSTELGGRFGPAGCAGCVTNIAVRPVAASH